MPTTEEISAHIEKLQKINDIMHDALCVMMISTTTNHQEIANKALGDVHQMLERK